ncbi:hypothetical protein D3Z36_05145 [Lachnospiraceae bacterium]|nr:hypothetical protein [Lachnospiraceae bacterium]
MIIFVGILVLLTVAGIRKAEGTDRHYMSIEMTNSIKGFFLCLVFFSHIWTYTKFTHPVFDAPYLFLRKLGQCIVVMFLFYSGYGVMESVKKKGEEYVKGIPVQRFLQVLLQFDAAILLFWLYRIFTGVNYDIKRMVLTFAGWETIGNSNWYIFSILWLYLFTFIAFRVFKKNRTKAANAVFLMSLLFMVVMRKLGRPYYYYDTVLCYSWGILFSLYRKKIEDFINESFQTWLFCLSMLGIGYLATYFFRHDSLIVYQIWIFCFVAAIVTFTMRLVIDSKPLQWLGRNLFPLYILQRLPMLILQPYMLPEDAGSIQKYLYVAVCFLCTLVISVLYRETIARGIGKVIRKK